jgi:hypothetical protein
MAVHHTPYRLMAAVFVSFLLLLSTTTSVVDGFVVPCDQRSNVLSPCSATLARHLSLYPLSLSQQTQQQQQSRLGFAPPRSLVVSANQKNDESSSSSSSSIGLNESDQGILGVAGTLAALITFYSEFTLKQTGCGLPAGPFGLVGLIEGLSYLSVTGIVAYSLVKKVQSVRVCKESTVSNRT